MIDEAELHVHPGWQCIVVEQLRDTFPVCLFILTTHSAQVIASVASRRIRLLKNVQVYAAPAPTEERSSNVYEKAMCDMLYWFVIAM